MDRKNLGILLTILILILAVFLGMELADARTPEPTQVPATSGPQQEETASPVTEGTAAAETVAATEEAVPETEPVTVETAPAETAVATEAIKETTAPTEETTGSTLPPNMLPIG